MKSFRLINQIVSVYYVFLVLIVVCLLISGEAQWLARLPRCMIVQKRCGPVVSASTSVVFVQKRCGPVVSASTSVVFVQKRRGPLVSASTSVVFVQNGVAQWLACLPRWCLFRSGVAQ